MQIDSRTTYSPWPHRWAVVLACATFPLVWLGGLVTTTDAGMAVPDWPSTYGYNLFLYPWQTWLAGPWDIFVEHGHRMLGAVVGMITIGLVAVIWRNEQRRWLRGVSLAALALVILQGVLGGMRVLLDERTLAMLHGCTGPLFFGLTVAMTVFTSPRWQASDVSGMSAGRGQVCILAVVTCILAYLQILLGALMRHMPVATDPITFMTAVRFHLFLAAILSLHIVVLVWSVVRHARHIHPLGGLACILAGLLTLQLALGGGTWMVRFAAPAWVPQWATLSREAVQDGGWLQTHVITAHVAVGSLLFVTSLALALYACRFLSLPLGAATSSSPRLEAAV
jgi:cytochrome c oxidase assembly protein subunit 15